MCEGKKNNLLTSKTLYHKREWDKGEVPFWQNTLYLFYFLPFRCFTSWEELAGVPKFADCAVVTTQDQLHLEPTVALAQMGSVSQLPVFLILFLFFLFFRLFLFLFHIPFHLCMLFLSSSFQQRWDVDNDDSNVIQVSILSNAHCNFLFHTFWQVPHSVGKAHGGERRGLPNHLRGDSESWRHPCCVSRT